MRDTESLLVSYSQRDELSMKNKRATFIDSVRRLRNECMLGFWCLTPWNIKTRKNDRNYSRSGLKEFRLDLFYITKGHSLYILQFVIIWRICAYEGTAKKKGKGSEEAPFRGCIFLDGDEDFFLLNVVSWYQKSCKSLTELNSGVNYKLAMEIFYLVRLLRIFIVEFSKMCIICWPAVLEVRRKHRIFIFPYSSSFYQLVWIGMSWEEFEVELLWWTEIKSWIFAHTRSLCTTQFK